MIRPSPHPPPNKTNKRCKVKKYTKMYKRCTRTGRLMYKFVSLFMVLLKSCRCCL